MNIKVKVLACAERKYQPKEGEARIYYSLTVLLGDDTAKVSSSMKFSPGSSATLELYADRRTGGISVRVVDIA